MPLKMALLEGKKSGNELKLKGISFIWRGLKTGLFCSLINQIII